MRRELLVVLLVVVGCGGKKEEPEEKPGRRGPKVVNVHKGPGASPKKLRQYNAQGGKIIYTNKEAGGRLYQAYVRGPQTRAYYVQIVNPLQQAILRYHIENSKYPDTLEELGEDFTPIASRMPEFLGLRYDNKTGKIDLVRYGAK